MRVALVIPAYNSARFLPALFDGIDRQKVRPDDILVIDSDLKDATRDIALRRGARVIALNGRKFNHGGTRRWASEQTDADILIFVTHDAVPANDDAFERLLKPFLEFPDVGMAYGRQLPSPDANPIAAHHRLFNYPATSRIKRRRDIPELGTKTVFASDSFAAYRAVTLRAVGGFPEDVIFGEDAMVAGRMILQGYAVAYAGDAEVFHSHNYSIGEEFRRYFDSGVFFSRNSWLSRNFGGTTGEGVQFVKSEFAYLRRTGNAVLIPRALLATIAKFAGFRIGHVEKYIPSALKRRIGMFSAYWA